MGDHTVAKVAAVYMGVMVCVNVFVAWWQNR